MNRGLVVAAVVFATGCLASVRREPVERIVFASTRRGNTDIYLANADGTGLRRLTTDTAADRQPRCSRDRRHVVFVRGDGPGRAIYRIDLADGSEHRLTPAGVYDYTPTWAPGGDRIYFTRGGSGGVSDRLAEMRKDGAKLTRDVVAAIMSGRDTTRSIVRLLATGAVRGDGVVAWTFAAAGERDSAFARLDRAIETRSVQFVPVLLSSSPRMLETDPRWAAIERRVGLRH